MNKQEYGSTGVELSRIGFGGILVMDETASEASRLVSKAVDYGINYFDVAPNYGNAQDMLGPALEPYRKNVFLACKTHQRSGKGAQEDLTNSLKLLKTDYLDLYQFHAVTTKKDVDTILGPGGAMEVVQQAHEDGILRFIGFSAHTEEAALALFDAYPFDSVLFPLNWATWHKGDFGKKVIPEAQAKGAAVLALKSLAKRSIGEGEEKKWEKCWYHPVDSYEEAKLGLRFTLSLPVTAAVSPGHEHLLDWMVKAESELEPLTPEEDQMLKEKAQEMPLIFDSHHSRWEEES